MEKPNKFIILITAYNDEKWVEYNIASILNQTYSNYEVRFYDDSSIDNTYQKTLNLTKDNSKFKIFTRKENKGVLYSHTECFKKINDEDIVICMSGDDWFFDENVLENLNNYYNKTDVWMTYGKFYCWNGESNNVIEANPQNTEYSDFTHDYKLYKKDIWRASHLRTFKGFLCKKLPIQTYKSKLDNKFFDHAADLAMSFPCLELCSKEKIGVVDFPTYVYNVSPSNQLRTQNRESNPNNSKYELEIRNRKTYKTLENKTSIPQKLPQINVFGDIKERHTIPTQFSYVYNLNQGEYDLSFLQDDSILKYLNKEILTNNSQPIVALVAEGPHLFNQKEVYEKVIQNHHKFTKILGWHESLHSLPNFEFFPITEISQWNLLPEKLDINKFKIYNKSKQISFIASNKNMCPGHQLRLECLNEVSNLKLDIDIFGRGINPISSKLDGLKNYYYSIAMENEQLPFYFTEKIIDCFLSGTIPIYYGCSNIENYFNPKGIISFNNKKELIDILNNLDSKFYDNNIEAIKENYDIAQSMWMDNDRMFNKYLNKLI
jgi:glycosyltransferase involved in cell wall biosynthesis